MSLHEPLLLFRISQVQDKLFVVGLHILRRHSSIHLICVLLNSKLFFNLSQTLVKGRSNLACDVNRLDFLIHRQVRLYTGYHLLFLL